MYKYIKKFEIKFLLTFMPYVVYFSKNEVNLGKLIEETFKNVIKYQLSVIKKKIFICYCRNIGCMNLIEQYK